MHKTFSVFRVAIEAWKLTWAHKGFLLALGLVYTLISVMSGESFTQLILSYWGTVPMIITVVLSVVLSVIITFIMLVNTVHLAEGRTDHGWNVLGLYPFSHYIRTLAAWILWFFGWISPMIIVCAFVATMLYFEVFTINIEDTVAMSVGAVLLLATLVYGIWFAFRYAFVGFATLIHGAYVLESFSISAELTRGVKLKLLGGYIMYCLVFVFLTGIIVAGLSFYWGFSESFVTVGTPEWTLLGVSTIIEWLVLMSWYVLYLWMLMGMSVAYTKLRSQEQKRAVSVENEDEVAEQEQELVIEEDTVNEEEEPDQLSEKKP